MGVSFLLILSDVARGKGLAVKNSPKQRLFVLFTVLSLLIILSRPSGADIITIYEGLNLVSSLCNITVNSTFNNTNAFKSVWKWANGNWQVYLPEASDGGSSYASEKGFGFLSSISPGEGFWVNGKLKQSVTITCSPPTDATIQINKGWNLRGLKSENKVYVEDAFGDSVKYKSVWKWENNQWSVYLPGQDTTSYANSKGFGVLSYVVPNEGFWVNTDTTAQLDTSLSTIPEKDIPKAAAEALFGTYVPINTATSAQDLVESIPDKLFSYEHPMSQGLGTVIQKALDEVIKNASIKAGLKSSGLYGSYSISTSCSYGGSISIIASWTGPDNPSSPYDLSNVKLTINGSNCTEQNITFNGSVEVTLNGNLASPTGGYIKFSNCTGNTILGGLQTYFNYPNLYFNFTISGNLTTLTADGNGTVTVGQQPVNFAMKKLNIELISYGSYQLSKINGGFMSSITNGWIKYSTPSDSPLKIDASGNIVSGKLNLETMGTLSHLEFQSNGISLFRKGKLLKTYKSIEELSKELGL